jgi:hypothetical protein
MTRLEIVEFYRKYKTQIIAEMQEYLDQPLKNMVKLDNSTYLVIEDGIEAEYYFRKQQLTQNYFPDSDVFKYIDDSTRNNYNLSWKFSDTTNKELKTSKNFLRALASGLKVVVDFISNNEVDSISFAPASKGHENLYFGSTFVNRLKTLLGGEYDIIFNKDDSQIILVNKKVSKLKQAVIEKRAAITNLEESTLYWKYPLLHSDTPLNVKVKNKIKKSVIKKLYLN